MYKAKRKDDEKNTSAKKWSGDTRKKRKRKLGRRKIGYIPVLKGMPTDFGDCTKMRRQKKER